MTTITLPDAEDSEDPYKWCQESLWPKQKWHKIDNTLDINSMYDGRRRDGKKQLVIP
jgi:hypothetical protein